MINFIILNNVTKKRHPEKTVITLKAFAADFSNNSGTKNKQVNHAHERSFLFSKPIKQRTNDDVKIFSSLRKRERGKKKRNRMKRVVKELKLPLQVMPQCNKREYNPDIEHLSL